MSRVRYIYDASRHVADNADGADHYNVYWEECCTRLGLAPWPMHPREAEDPTSDTLGLATL